MSPTVEAQRYRIVVSADQNFQSILETAVVDQPTFTSAGWTYPEGPLYWRVQAIDGSGNNLTFGSQLVRQEVARSQPDLTACRDLRLAERAVPLARRCAYAAGYQVEIYKDGDTTGSSANRIVSGTTKQVAYTPPSPLPASANAYTWRVRPLDAGDRPGVWTDLGDPGARFFVSPAAPVQTSPGNNVWVKSTLGLFTWTAVAGATSYRFERRLAGAAGSSETVVTPALAWAPTARIGDGNWEWRVSTIDADGKVSGSSPWRAFRVDATPPVIKKVKPPRNKLKPKSLIVVVFSEAVKGVSKKSLYVTLEGKKKKMKAKVTMNKAKTKATVNVKPRFKRGKTYVLHATSKIKDLRGNVLADGEAVSLSE